MSIDKKNLRNAIRQINKQCLTSSYYAEASLAICHTLKTLPIWEQAEKIALYHALPDEPDLAPLLSEYATSKQLFLPKVEDAEDIAFYPYFEEKSLSIGSYGIAEPSFQKELAVLPETLDLIIIPGLAFTPKRGRMGRGKGYYDRFLPQTQATLIGVTFRYRLLPHLPHDTWDFLMHHVITD